MTSLFPTVRARSLEGSEILLPGGLTGDPSVVILAFRREQQRDVDTWIPWLLSLRERLPGLEVYELPAIKRRWLPARGFIDGGMRAGIADAETRKRTLTAYTDVAALTETLEIESTSAIAVVVVSRQGAVLWRGHGSYAPASAAELEHAATAARLVREAEKGGQVS